MAEPAQQVREGNYKQALLRATATIRQLLDENAALRSKEDIGVVGMACRFPGGANNPEQFWRLLRDGVDAITDVPPARWSAGTHHSADPTAPGKMYTVRGGFLDSPIADFDAGFFGISPREARALDPQHRLLLEVSWEALENACLDPTRLKQSKTGVFVGLSSDDYVQAHRHSGQPERIDAYSMLGSTFSTAVGRISYTLGLQGPCMALDTACSSSLVAVHLACQSLRSGESDLALVGGVNLMLSPESHICFSKLQAISPHGKCRTFDASADGYVRGEGCGVVVLQRLRDARAQSNRILAVVRGSAVNQDGKTNGLAAPNGNAQQAVIRQALDNAGLQPAQIDYIEAHGTGTILGDPIEVEALGAVFGSGRDEPLRLGAVKTNIGHLEPAAGVAGLIKIILSLQHEELPATLHFEHPNPHIAWNRLPLRVTSARSAWRRSARSRIAGLSSFGFSGTNAHVILEEAPAAEHRPKAVETASCLLCLSARDQPALRTLAADYLAMLSADQPEPATILDVCYSASAGRRHWAQRVAIEGNDPDAIRSGLAAFLQDRPDKRLAAGRCDDGAGPKLAFLFPGQGSQYVGMGRGLYQRQTVFKDAIDRCDALLRPSLNTSLVELLFSADADTLNRTIFAEPALFALGFALSQLWAAWGVRPNLVMGHGVGEYVAACVAGVFSLEDAIRLIAERSRSMQSLPTGGSMAAVFAPADVVAAALASCARHVAIAAINGPEHVVISGETNSIQAVVAALTRDGIRATTLPVSHAVHSHLMEPMLHDFERIAREVSFSPPHTKLVSNVTGQIIGAEIARPSYWIDQIRQPVAFFAGMQTLRQEGTQVFMEMGPQATLLGMGRHCIASTATNDTEWLPSLRPNAPDVQTLNSTLGTLYVKGASIDWAAVHAGQDCRWTALPHYPFQRRRYWIDSPRIGGTAASVPVQPRVGPLLDRMTRSPLLQSILFETRFSLADMPVLDDHRVFGKVVVSGACMLSMILGAAAHAFGDGTIQLSDVVLHQALVIPDNDARLVHLAFTPGGNDQVPFKLVSLDAAAQTGSAITHVSGSVRMLPGSSSPPMRDLSPEGHGRLDREMPGSDVYEAHRRRHITLGASNRWLESLRFNAKEAVGRFCLPNPGDAPNSVAEGYQIHPGLLDSWLSLPVAIAGFDGDRPWVPFALNQLTLFCPPAGARFRAYAKRRQLPDFTDRLVGDLWLADGQGNLVAECLGFEGRPTTAELLLRDDRRDLGSWFYRMEWPDAATPQPSGAEPTDSWLVFIDDAGYGAALAQRIAVRGRRVVTIIRGSRFEQLSPDRFCIDPLQPDDMALMLQTAFPTHTERFRAIYLWGLDARAADAESLEGTIGRACAPVLHFVRAIGRAGQARTPPLVLVTRGAQPIGSPSAPSSDPVEVAQAPLWGLGKTVAIEHPEFACRRIDLDPRQGPETIDFLLAELLAPDSEDQIAQRGDRRHVARLARYRPPLPAPLPIDPDASYLVCGGFGGLGRLVARELVTRGARYLTLCGRNTTGPDAAEFIAELGRSGARIQACAADLTRSEDVQTVIATASADRPIKGIVHAAGVLDDAVLTQLDWQRFAQVLAVKTVGYCHLHEFSRQQPLDFFIGFSSMVSLIGSLAQGAYVAANSFVDALMHARRSQGLPGLSINWGPWSEAGMAARLDEHQRLRVARQGIVFLSTTDAFQALDRLWHDAPPQVAVMHVDWPQFFQHSPDALHLPLLELLRAPANSTAADAPKAPPLWIEQLKQTLVSRRRAALTSMVQQELARVLGAGAREHIGLRQPLFELGVDSLMAVEIRNRLSSALTCPLSTTLLFDYPTLESLVAYLCTVIPGIEFDVRSSETTEPIMPGSSAAADAFDHLSEAELESMLAEKLRAMAE